MAYKAIRLVAFARTEDDHSAASDEQDAARRKGNGTGTTSGGQLALRGVGHVGGADVEVLLCHVGGRRGVALVGLVEVTLKASTFW